MAKSIFKSNSGMCCEGNAWTPPAKLDCNWLSTTLKQGQALTLSSYWLNMLLVKQLFSLLFPWSRIWYFQVCCGWSYGGISDLIGGIAGICQIIVSCLRQYQKVIYIDLSGSFHYCEVSPIYLKEILPGWCRGATKTKKGNEHRCLTMRMVDDWLTLNIYWKRKSNIYYRQHH